jgi:hypothetical protein
MREMQKGVATRAAIPPWKNLFGITSAQVGWALVTLNCCNAGGFSRRRETKSVFLDATFFYLTRMPTNSMRYLETHKRLKARLLVFLIQGECLELLRW